MKYIYVLNGLSFSYDKGEAVFSGMNMKIPYEGVTILTGKNGAGKTTLCRILTGLAKGYHGSAAFFDKELNSVGQNYILNKIIYIKQDLTGNIIGLTANEDLKVWQNRFVETDSEQKENRRKSALRWLQAGQLFDKPVWELSYGQRRKAMLSSLPLFMDKYWIIDEPSANLDAAGIELLFRLIKKKTTGKCGALILTHRPEHFKELIRTDTGKVAGLNPERYFAIKEHKIVVRKDF